MLDLEASRDDRDDDRLPILRQGVFDHDLGARVQAALVAQEPLALIMMDLDRFKAVNDAHSHLIGNEVLLEVARRLKKAVGTKGSIYRYGGDEITILLANYSGEEAAALAERLRKDLEAAPMSSKKLSVTASLGVACLPEHASTPTELVRKGRRRHV